MFSFRPFILSLLFVPLLFSPVFSAVPRSDFDSSRVNARTYLPGDFVHLVVQAPVDTSQITATMPDDTVVNMIQDRRTNIWRGIWQVPDNFGKGTYSATLTAVDVQGNVFTGQTDSFDVGELKLITLIGKATPEAPPAPVIEPPALTEVITSEPGPSTVPGEEALIKLIKKIMPATTAPEPAPEMAPAMRDRLIASNLQAGHDAFQQEKYSEAASFFRVVLYLAPDNAKAGSLLAKAQQMVKQENERRQAAQREETKRLLLILSAAGFLAAVVLAALFVFIFSVARRHEPAPAAPAGGPAPPMSDKEKQAIWFEKIGWQKDPFSSDVLQQLFPEGSKLELDGLKNYLRVRIEEAGGRGIEPFTGSALEKIFSLSKGNPGLALKICDWALTQAYRRGEFLISAELVRGYELVSSPKILIADDEEVIRSVLNTILRRGGGYETDFAADGEEALKKVKENSYSLVLLDVEMPKLNGYDVLKAVRAFSPELPIIFVTGKGQPQKVLESLSQYDLTGYIEKPFVPEKVLDLVARAIKK